MKFSRTSRYLTLLLHSRVPVKHYALTVCGYGLHRSGMIMYSNYGWFGLHPDGRPVGAEWTKTNGVSLISFGGRWARLSGSGLMILAIVPVKLESDHH